LYSEISSPSFLENPEDEIFKDGKLGNIADFVSGEINHLLRQLYSPDCEDDVSPSEISDEK
jgi:hypothetical protein